MSKKKFKLDLNKQLISNFEARQITGGVTAGICLRSLHTECPWSRGSIDASNADLCDPRNP